MSTADVIANTQLVLRERESRDRGWWAVMGMCFFPDSTVNVGWFEGSGADFVAGSARLAANGGGATHRLAPPTVHLAGERAVVVLGAVITTRAVIDDVEVELEATSRIVYRTERRDGQWGIVCLDCVYSSDRLTPVVPGQQLHVPAEELAGLRPSYRMLAWSFVKRGIPVRHDLLGDDLPERVVAFERDAFAWAGLPPAA